MHRDTTAVLSADSLLAVSFKEIAYNNIRQRFVLKL